MWWTPTAESGSWRAAAVAASCRAARRGCVERIRRGENEKMEREENKLEKKKMKNKRGIFLSQAILRMG